MLCFFISSTVKFPISTTSFQSFSSSSSKPFSLELLNVSIWSFFGDIIKTDSMRISNTSKHLTKGGGFDGEPNSIFCKNDFLVVFSKMIPPRDMRISRAKSLIIVTPCSAASWPTKRIMTTILNKIESEKIGYLTACLIAVSHASICARKFSSARSLSSFPVNTDANDGVGFWIGPVVLALPGFPFSGRVSVSFLTSFNISNISFVKKREQDAPAPFFRSAMSFF
mmetsp:Transcript_7767/g.19317  ORF Transcript_7767/g.19317 Transcript_7767/m.19317 type:complete len:225 (-) Transcript_7767:1216-1890(-)